MATCIHCKAQIPEGAAFCPACGQKQVKRYQQTFYRDKMSEDQFIQKINQWFAQYPKVANVKARFMINSGVGLFVNKYVLDAFAIEYELFSGTNDNQYAVVALHQTGLSKLNTDALLHQWQQANPGAIVLKRDGGVHQRGDAAALVFMNGFGAMNKTQLYVFFKFDRKNGTGVPTK